MKPQVQLLLTAPLLPENALLSITYKTTSSHKSKKGWGDLLTKGSTTIPPSGMVAPMSIPSQGEKMQEATKKMLNVIRNSDQPSEQLAPNSSTTPMNMSMSPPGTLPPNSLFSEKLSSNRKFHIFGKTGVTWEACSNFSALAHNVKYVSRVQDPLLGFHGRHHHC